MQESGIFKAVIKLPITERAAYLDRECGSNIALRHELEELLGVRVDLLTPHDLPVKFRAQVISEAVPV